MITDSFKTQFQNIVKNNWFVQIQSHFKEKGMCSVPFQSFWFLSYTKQIKACTDLF